MTLPEAVLSFAARAGSVRVLVIGDCMLDTYIAGSASRISPEAPVPVVNVSRSKHVPGGAANVAANARAMGAGVSLVGVVGQDAGAAALRAELDAIGVSGAGLLANAGRRTTTKTRVTAAGQQIVRFDEEDAGPLEASVAAELRQRCERAMETAGVCILSDYAKGVVDAALCRCVIDRARLLQIPVVVDPKVRDLGVYRGATLITPNLKEAAAAAGEPIEDAAGFERAARLLLERIAPSSLLITRGEEGMSLFENGGLETHLPAVVNEVADVTGAGDTVVSALAIALGCGFTLREAAQIANVAAGVAVSHAGTWAVRAQELIAAS